MKKIYIKIEGMVCNHCYETVKPIINVDKKYLTGCNKVIN